MAFSGCAIISVATGATGPTGVCNCGDSGNCPAYYYLADTNELLISSTGTSSSVERTVSVTGISATAPASQINRVFAARDAEGLSSINPDTGIVTCNNNTQVANSVAYDPNNNMVYTADYSNEMVYAYDARDCALVNSYNVRGFQSEFLARPVLDLQANSLLIPVPSASAVKVLELGTGNVTEYPQSSPPQAIAVDPTTGDVYVGTNSEIMQYPAGEFTTPRITAGAAGAVAALAVNSKTRRLYALILASPNQLKVYDADSLTLLDVIPNVAPYTPNENSLAVDETNNLIYVAQYAGDSRIIDGNTDTIVGYGPLGTSVSIPRCGGSGPAGATECHVNGDTEERTKKEG